MKKLLFNISVILFSMNMFSQVNFWGYSTETSVSNLPKVVRESTPNKYELFTLKLNDLKTELLAAPKASSGVNSDIIISFPNPNGGFNRFKIYNNPVTDESYTKSHPDVNSYSGQDVDNPTSTIRFGITMYGLNAMIFTNEGTYYIDSFTKDLNNYIVYFKKNLTTNKLYECSTIDDRSMHRMLNNNAPVNTQRMSDGNYRTYKLAVSCTNEFSTYHINVAGLSAGTDAQKKEAVYQAIVVGMTRLNGIYEKELAVHLSLIYNTAVLYITSSDPYANDNTDRTVVGGILDAAIGNTNYDIGHVFTTHSGLASVGCICGTSKARGTNGGSAPVGDPFFVDFVAHELGHQFGANHTFAATNGGNCTSSTVNNNTAVEPGSGTTIMGYAGICAPVDVQPHSDDYFHAVSLAEIKTVILATNCAVSTPNGNSAPVVNAGSDYTLPISTPFKLTGSAADANGDTLTYCWEQIDFSNAAGSPYFRSFTSTSSPTRYFPSLSYVMQGNLTSDYERCPTYSRNMNFALTARDNKVSPIGGQTGRDDMQLTVDETKGPFAVTSQNTAGVDWIGNSTYTVTWNVANTNALAANVKILLSIDGGATYPTTVLLASTPNDGTQTITAPNINAQNCRIFVEAVGNVFYNVSSATFRVKQQLFANVTGTNITTVGGSNGTASATPSGGMTTADYSVVNTFPTAPIYSYGSPSNTAITVSTLTVPAIPAGAVINSATLNLINVYAYDPSYLNEIRVYLSGAYTLGSTKLYTPNGAGALTPNPAINLPNFPASGGTINLRLAETINDSGADAVIDSANITVSYTLNGYTYSWSNGATTATINNLAAGTYTVAVTDASGGTATGSYTVLNPLQITASASANGTISPNGTAVVTSGNNQSYTITPNSGFNVQDVLVDSASQGAITTYTFNNVAANHTISATFAAIVNPSAAPGASTSQSFCQGATVANLSATGTALQWYNVASGGTALATNTVLVSAGYYVTQSIGGVESSRTSVIVTIDSNCGGIPTSKVKANQCGTTLSSLSANINADYVAGYQAYRFEVTNGAAVNTVDVNKYNFSLTQTPGITYGTTYGVRVAVKMGGTWGAYGASCNVSTPVLTVNTVPITTILPSLCGTTLASKDSKITAVMVTGATNGRYEITKAGSAPVVYEVASTVIKLAQTGVAVLNNASYSIRVAAFVGGVWGNYGASCTVTTPSVTAPARLKAKIFEVSAYPNPFETAFYLNIETPSKEDVTIAVYDMMGKLVESHQVSPTEITNLQIGNNFTTGIYNVIVSQANEMQAIRLIRK